MQEQRGQGVLYMTVPQKKFPRVYNNWPTFPQTWNQLTIVFTGSALRSIISPLHIHSAVELIEDVVDLPLSNPMSNPFASVGPGRESMISRECKDRARGSIESP